jgi:hypothetical protein
MSEVNMSTFLPILLLFNLSGVDLIGTDWAAVESECLPGIDSVDWRTEVDGDAGAIIWWCEDEKFGLREFTRVSQRGGPAVQKLLSDTRDAAMIIESAPFRLRPNAADAAWVATMRQKFTPLCTAADSRAINSDGIPIGDLKVGQRIACGGLKMVQDHHYCMAIGAPQADGSLLPLDAWVQCEVMRAPDAGWEL